MARLPAQGDNHGNLLAKIVENTFTAVVAGGIGPAGPPGPQGPPGSGIVGIESSADATAIWLTAAEFVGIGTSAPEGLLHVFAGDSTASPNAAANTLVVESNAADMGMSLLCQSGATAYYMFGNVFASALAYVAYNMTANQMLFQTNNAVRMSIDLAGQVGIGTTAPDGRLHVVTASAGLVTASVFSDDLVVENNDHGGMSILTPNDKVGSISFGDTENNAVGILAYNHAIDTLTLRAGGLDVVDVISTALQPNADNAFTLGTSVRRWSEVFAVNNVINTSDAREKNSITVVSTELAITLLNSIVPRSYIWNNSSGTHYGFIAQEVEIAAAAAGLTTTDFGPLFYDQENDRYGLRQAELLPFLWSVVQDQQKRIQMLEYAYGH